LARNSTELTRRTDHTARQKSDLPQLAAPCLNGQVPLTYHAGQIAVQEEANTRKLADQLAHWVGPVGMFMSVADLVILAVPFDGSLRFLALSGRAPLVEVVGPTSLRLPIADFPGAGPSATKVGGIAISLAQLRRARLNGDLVQDGASCVLEAAEAFTNCRKYIAPSRPLEDALHVGPELREVIALDDEWLKDVLKRAETAFLASVSPDGQPDASHRGGPPGFLTLDATNGSMSWPEYIGDGMLKSAGNVRATGAITLLVLDLITGDAAEITGSASYKTIRLRKQPREDGGLERNTVPFPVQGQMDMVVTRAERLRRVIVPRARLERALKVTSTSPLEEQAPQ